MDAMDDNTPQPAAEELERSFSRRALVQAGWTVPVIFAVAPLAAFAASGVQHVDAVHNDHIDAGAHVDVAVQASSQKSLPTQQALPFNAKSTAKAQKHQKPKASRVNRSFTG